MTTKIVKTLFVIIVVCFISIFSSSQSKHKFKEFEYDQIFNKIKIKTEDDSEYAIENIIIAQEKFIKSKYEQNTISTLYSDTQDYFRSLIGKNAVIVKKASDSEDYIFKLDDGKILNYDLVRRGLAVYKNVPTNEFKKNEEEGFDIYEKNSLTNFIFLLSESKDRLEEVKSLIDLYQKKFQKDYIWYLLKANVVNLELGYDLERIETQKIAECYKEALELNPKLIDLNKHIAFCYHRDFDQMIKKEKPRDYVFINEYIKYAQIFIDSKSEDISKGNMYLQLANAFYLKDDYRKSYECIKKYIEEGTRPRENKSEKEKLGISFSWEILLSGIGELSKFDLDNIMTLLKEIPLSSKIKIYYDIMNLIKAVKIEFYAPTEQDEIKTKEIEKDYYLSKIEKLKIKKNIMITSLYVLLGLFVLNLFIIIFLEIKKKRRGYSYISIMFILIFALGSLIFSKNFQHDEKKYSNDIDKISSEISILKEKEKEKEEKKNKAIELAKKHAYWVKNRMGDEKGDVRIIGWKAEEKEKDIYLVSFTYDTDEQKGVGWYFEVQLSAEIVRPMSGDKELQKKYGLQDAKK